MCLVLKGCGSPFHVSQRGGISLIYWKQVWILHYKYLIMDNIEEVALCYPTSPLHTDLYGGHKHKLLFFKYIFQILFYSCCACGIFLTQRISGWPFLRFTVSFITYLHHYEKMCSFVFVKIPYKEDIIFMMILMTMTSLNIFFINKNILKFFWRMLGNVWKYSLIWPTGSLRRPCGLFCYSSIW